MCSAQTALAADFQLAPAPFYDWTGVYVGVPLGAYHIPRHWSLFDPASIRRLGEAAGFSLRKIVFNPAALHWAWTFHNLTVTREDWIGRLGRRMFAQRVPTAGSKFPSTALSR
jgi:hypothetical protein